MGGVRKRPLLWAHGVRGMASGRAGCVGCGEGGGRACVRFNGLGIWVEEVEGGWCGRMMRGVYSHACAALIA